MNTYVRKALHSPSFMVLLFLAIILAWGLLKAYDEPIREWLKEHWLKKRKAGA